MLTVVCVLKSGGYYNAEWVDKLQRGVDRHMSVPHRFACLSDVPVNCFHIPLKHDWPAWWAKIELFRRGAIQTPALYLDLDTIITGSLDELTDIDHDFAMLRNFHDPTVVASGVMWFRKVPHEVYKKFSGNAWSFIQYYQQFKRGNHLGDQAFIADTLDRDKIGFIENPRIKSYKKHCRESLPEDASLVCYHGAPRPWEIKTPWMREHWA